MDMRLELGLQELGINIITSTAWRALIQSNGTTRDKMVGQGGMENKASTFSIVENELDNIKEFFS
jgi:hypothetical protein